MRNHSERNTPMPYLQNRFIWLRRFAGVALFATVLFGGLSVQGSEVLPTEKAVLETREDLRDLLKIWQWYVLPSAGFFDAGWYPFFPSDAASERLLSALVPGSTDNGAAVFLSEDEVTGETFFQNAFGEIIDSLPAPQGYSPLWIAEDRGEVSSPGLQGYLPSMVSIKVRLMPVASSGSVSESGTERVLKKFRGSSGTSGVEKDGASGTADAETSMVLESVPTRTGGTNENRAVSVPALARSVIYVDRALGNDSLSGKARMRSGSTTGPKQTVSAGLQAVRNGDRLVIREGHYGDRLDVRGRAVRVRVEGRVVLKGNRMSRVVPVPESAMKQTVSSISTGMVVRVTE